MDDNALIDQALADVFGMTTPDAAILDGFRKEITLSRLDAGDVLLQQGAPSDALYVLLRGRLVVTVENDGETTVVGEIRRGETIGETGLVMKAPRNASVQATRDSAVARIGAESFERLLGIYPQLGLAIARTLILREQRKAGPRHPGFVPETICILPVTRGVDLRAVANAISAHHQGPVTLIEEGDSPTAGRKAVHSAERDTGRVLILASGNDAAWRDMALAEADEVVRVADATAAPAPAPEEEQLDRRRSSGLPRQTLLLVHPDDTRSPTGTAAWLVKRNIDRHLHARLGNDGDMARVTRLLTGRAIGLALAGGGARGAAHLGAIRALLDSGISPDIVGGSSIGAAMAAWYAMGLRGKALQAAAHKVFVSSGGPTNDWNLLPMLSLVKGRKTQSLTREAIREVTGADIGIEDMWVPFFCVAANYSSHSQTVLRRGPLWQTLAATYAIPGVLPPVLFDGDLLVDGGVVNNLPVDVLQATGASRTIAVDLMGGSRRKIPLQALPSNVALLLDKLRPRRKRRYHLPGLISILFNSTVLSSLERQRDMRQRADLCLQPGLTRVGLLDWSKFNLAIEQGYTTCSEQIAAMPEEALARLRQ